MTVSQDKLIPFLDLATQHQSIRLELLQVLAEAIENAGFVGGPMVKGFEADFAHYVGTGFAIGVGSGTAALRLTLLSLGLTPGAGVITVPNTFIATVEAITQAGGRIEFVDCEPDTCLLDPNRLEAWLKQRFSSGPKEARPAAIIPVHLYGQCADMDAILELARRYELKVLEDAAQAHGATYRGRPAGSLGDAAAFSFYPGKNLGALGEAGAVTTNNPAITEQVRMLRDHGQRTKYYHVTEGYNERLDAIQAGFLKVKLKYLDGWNQKRAVVAAIYDGAFAGVNQVRPVTVSPHNVSCYHLYVIHVSNRDELQGQLKSKGIQTGLHYPVPLHLQECYAHLGFARGSFPNAEKSAGELLSLPIFPEMEPEEALRVATEVINFCQSL